MPPSKLQDLLRKHVLREALDPIATVEKEKTVAPSPEENAVMTELRKRWEQEKADLRREGSLAGEAKGKTEGKAEAILAVMRARGFPVSERIHGQILSCRDLSILDRWLVRAATAASEAEVIAA